MVVEAAAGAEVNGNDLARDATAVLTGEPDEAGAVAAQRAIEGMLIDASRWGSGRELGRREKAVWSVLRNAAKLARQRAWGTTDAELARILIGTAGSAVVHRSDRDVAAERLAVDLVEEVARFVRSWSPGPAEPQ